MIEQILEDFKLVIIPVAAFILAQLIKVVIVTAKRKFRWDIVGQYGGMPSAHAALVASLLTEVWLVQGVNSLSFTISAVLAIIVLRDALGLRQYIGNQSKSINKLVQRNGFLADQDKKEWPKLPEDIGHTGVQAAVGVILGFLTALLLLWLLPSSQKIFFHL